MSPTALWMYVCAAVLLVVGLIKIRTELPREHGIDKIMPFGRLFFAICMGVFGTEHFTATAGIASLIPHWIPWHNFWVYAVGTGFIAAAISMAVLVQARLAAALVGMTLLIFVIVMDVPAAIAHPENRLFWTLALRELAFSSGGFAYAFSGWSGRPAWTAFPRVCIGATAVFYGALHFLQPDHTPGVPLQQVTPEWIPLRFALSYFVGAVLLIAGVCLLINRKARLAATSLGLTILLTIAWVYLPMLIKAPISVLALNYFFDTLLFCGTILLLANALDRKTA